jgi:rod shape-determining protein MreD
MPALSIGRIIPNILIPWLIYIVWMREQNMALISGFIIGLLYDTLNPSTFGMHALLFSLMGLVINFLRIPFERDSLVAKLLTIGMANLLYSLLSLITYGFVWGFEAKLYTLILSAFVYNLLFSLVIFGTMQLISHLRLIVVHD